MDTSPEYFLQCEKALPDIPWEPEIGDYLVRRYTVFSEELDKKIWPDSAGREEILILHYKSETPEYFHGVTLTGGSRIVNFPDSNSMVKATSVPLWRQDQLQAMVNSSWHPFRLVNALKDFVREYPIDCTSMEQLWLAFVMKEKIGKTWDSKKEEWISHLLSF